jgi:hypothetical protein
MTHLPGTQLNLVSTPEDNYICYKFQYIFLSFKLLLERKFINEMLRYLGILSVRMIPFNYV